MSSFTLELDTTAPALEIQAPNYTTTYAETEIILTVDEPLAEWQDIYLLDPTGDRHDVVFSQTPDGFTGLLVMGTYGVGIMTLYARVRDDVGNVSELVRKSLDVRTSIDLDIRIDSESRSITAHRSRRPLLLQEAGRTIRHTEARRDVGMHDKIRKIEVADS